MIYVFNKNKIFSYILACCFVLMLFTFHESIIPNKDVELVKVSANAINNTDSIKENDIKNGDN